MTGTADDSFSRTFFRMMLVRIALALSAMGQSYAGAVLGETTGTEWGPFAGGVIGLAVGAFGAVVLLRRLPTTNTP